MLALVETTRVFCSLNGRRWAIADGPDSLTGNPEFSRKIEGAEQ